MQVLFRAKEKNSNNYVIGYEYYNHVEDEYYITHYVSGSNYKIDRTTRSINIEDMLDSKGNKIFASLQEDGRGGDLVVSKSYPFYGDAPEIRDSSGKCEELNYKGLLLFGSNGCLIDFVKVSDRVRGCAVGYLIEEFNKYNFEVVGIQE